MHCVKWPILLKGKGEGCSHSGGPEEDGMGMPHGWRSTSDCPEESKSPTPFTKQKPAFAPKEAMWHLIQRIQLW